MELTGILSVIRSRARLIVASAILGALGAFTVGLIMPPTYTSSVTLIVGGTLQYNITDFNQFQTAQQLAVTYAEAAKTRSLAESVIAQLHLSETPEHLLSRVAGVVGTNTPILTITANDRTAEGAARLANAFATQLIKRTSTVSGTGADLNRLVTDQISLTQTEIASTIAQITPLSAKTNRTAADNQALAALNQQLVSLQATLANLLQVQGNSSATLLSVIDPAVPPASPSSPRPLLDTALGGVLGLLLGLALAFAAASIDDRLRSSEDVEQLLEVPVLGSVGRLPKATPRDAPSALVMLRYPTASAAEAFRQLRTNLEFADLDAKLRRILVTSPSAGEGKSTVVANLGLAFAQAGKRTILVDADLRKPSLHELFALPNSVGLTTLVRSEPRDLREVLRAGDEPNLRVLTSGPLPGNPAELLGSQRLAAVLERLSAEADVLIIDSPPIRVVTDAAVLAAVTNGVLLVLQGRHSRARSARQALRALDLVGGHVLGVVLDWPRGRRGEADLDLYAYERPAAGSGAELQGVPPPGR